MDVQHGKLADGRRSFSWTSRSNSGGRNLDHTRSGNLALVRGQRRQPVFNVGARRWNRYRNDRFATRTNGSSRMALRVCLVIDPANRRALIHRSGVERKPRAQHSARLGKPVQQLLEVPADSHSFDRLDSVAAGKGAPLALAGDRSIRQREFASCLTTAQHRRLRAQRQHVPARKSLD